MCHTVVLLELSVLQEAARLVSLGKVTERLHKVAAALASSGLSPTELSCVMHTIQVPQLASADIAAGWDLACTQLQHNISGLHQDCTQLETAASSLSASLQARAVLLLRRCVGQWSHQQLSECVAGWRTNLEQQRSGLAAGKQAKAEADRQSKEAKAEADRQIEEAKAEADRQSKEAKAEADRQSKEAKAEADRQSKQAKAEADRQMLRLDRAHRTATQRASMRVFREILYSQISNVVSAWHCMVLQVMTHAVAGCPNLVQLGQQP